MKMKVKFNLSSVKDFLLEHGEKLAFCVVGLVFLMFAWSALKLESLDATKQPESLKSKADQVRLHVEQSKFDAPKAGVRIVDYDARSEVKPVKLVNYRIDRTFNPPLADARSKRDNPQTFPIEELRADSGYGSFALAGAGKAPGAAARPQAGNDDEVPRARAAAPTAGASQDAGAYSPKPDAALQARPYVIITGLVPWNKEVQEYNRVFQNADGGDRNRDVPHYEGFTLERAEINPAQPDKLDWQPLKTDRQFVNSWEGYMPEIAHKDYVEPMMTSKLGPLVTAKWGESATHPKIPLADADLTAAAAVPTPVEAPPAAAPVSDDPFERAGTVVSTTTTATAAQAAAAEGKPTVEHHLFRAFDFNVKPGKKYRYRAKAYLQNPNLNVAAKYLKKPVADPPKYLETELSAPTDLVAVPDRFNVLAGEVKKETRNPDPTATIMVTAIDEKEGIEAATELDVWRGSVANKVAATVEAVDPRNRDRITLTDMDFRSGIVVLDIRGGKPLSKKTTSTLTSPVEVLVIDPQGNLRVRNELDDATLLTRHKPVEEVAPKKKPAEKDIPNPKGGTRKRDEDEPRKPRTPRNSTRN
jgi:hypothetical protein